MFQAGLEFFCLSLLNAGITCDYMCALLHLVQKISFDKVKFANITVQKILVYTVISKVITFRFFFFITFSLSGF